jgi:hypothetical protein
MKKVKRVGLGFLLLFFMSDGKYLEFGKIFVEFLKISIKILFSMASQSPFKLKFPLKIFEKYSPRCI